ncbi:hypothetical protein Pan258_02350 [Symmachiella dynata]|nr:hypothetical protein Pan258_02350 [Symmachiella dynata]
MPILLIRREGEALGHCDSNALGAAGGEIREKSPDSSSATMAVCLREASASHLLGGTFLFVALSQAANPPAPSSLAVNELPFGTPPFDGGIYRGASRLPSRRLRSFKYRHLRRDGATAYGKAGSRSQRTAPPSFLLRYFSTSTIMPTLSQAEATVKEMWQGQSDCCGAESAEVNGYDICLCCNRHCSIE